jgi:hypothetical protein
MDAPRVAVPESIKRIETVVSIKFLSVSFPRELTLVLGEVL